MKTTLLPYRLPKNRLFSFEDHTIATRHLAKLGSVTVTRYRVDITLNERKARPQATIADWLSDTTTSLDVIATSPQAARDWALDRTQGIPCVEIVVYGPQGGIAAKSFRGWESAIWEQMMQTRATEEQLTLI